MTNQPEVVADALPELPFSPYIVSEWTGPEMVDRHSWTAYTADQMREYARAALATLPTQSAGVEERALGFQAAVALEVGADQDDQDDILLHVRAWVASAKGQAAAIRTKQPAASEGDGRAMLRECYEWLFESKADGPQVSEGAIERGYYTPEFRDLHDRLRAAIDNTSKQAAGEAVDDAMVDRACDAYDAVAFELANRTAIREALIAALAGTP